MRVLVLVLAFGCSKASDEGKRMQHGPPSEVAVPVGVTIAVSADGAERPPIDTAMLEAKRPDFVDEEHRAWRVRTLVAEAGDGALVEASSTNGVAVKFATPTAEGFEPVL